MATPGDRRLAATARRLLAMGGALQSTAGGVQIDEARLRTNIEREVRRNAVAEDGTVSETVVVAAATDVLANGARALGRAEGGDTAPNLRDVERASLEAIVHVIGRPALRLCNDKVEMPPELGDNDRWRVLIATARSKVRNVCAAVGRVMRGNGAAEALGTAWRIGKDLVVTNRHVVARLAADSARPAAEWTLAAEHLGFVEFGADACAGSVRAYAVTELVLCAPEAELDLAVLRIQSPGGAFPEGLTIRWSTDGVGRPVDDGTGGSAFKGEEVYVIGHPRRTYPSEAVRLVFGTADGTKRCSPGLVTRVANDKPTFEHDCSTLGGNSGSCVVSARWHAAVGLHYGAVGADELTARAPANLAIAFCAVAAHPVGARLSALSAP